MATILVNDVYELKVGCYCAGQAGINVSHWKCTASTGSGAADSDWALFADQMFAPFYKAAMAATANYYGVRTQRIAPLPVSVAVISATLTGVGTAGAIALPTQVSGIITLQTGLAGRGFRGRQYIPFPSTTSNDATLDTPTATYKGLIGGIGGRFGSSYNIGAGGNTVTMQPVLWKRTLAFATNITAYRANQKWATQRRRGNYGQANAYPPF
jgi:hypothetical protein